MPNYNIENLRKDYSINKLDDHNVPDDPRVLFSEWLEYAISEGVNEPTAMTLSTTDEWDFPDSRVVLLKGFDENGFRFFTNYNSNKGQQLNKEPKCALNFFWSELERQVRVKGIVSKLSAVDSDNYFYSRPEESQVSAIISPQSSIVTDRKQLEELKQNFIVNNLKITRPDHWGGYIVSPVSIEFWQGRPGRLHDRFLYVMNGEKWIRHRLAP